LGSDPNARTFTRGRYALAEAYRQCGVGPQGTLLAPAYHCRTMLDPALALGAEVLLYTQNPDLSPNLAALAHTVKNSTHPVKAMLLTHYFGFAQNLPPLAQFCQQHHIDLIEDCSHALFTHTDPSAPVTAARMGHTGRFGVASPYKFFPMEDGGTLWANPPHPLPASATQRPALRQELKGLLHALQHTHAPAPNTNTNTSTLHQDIAHLLAHPKPTGCDQLTQDEHTSANYHPHEAPLPSLAISRWVMRHTNIARLTQLRRQHYQQWVNAVAKLPHCTALFPELPTNTVPYMFPLKIDHPDVHFFTLKHLGMPVWRWDDMAVSSCPVATDYRLKVLHLPCHQELTPAQMAWMTSTVQQVMRQNLNGGKN
jgi:dTDP-4-amino-4,6-dideoxygalactose transaminase